MCSLEFVSKDWIWSWVQACSKLCRTRHGIDQSSWELKWLVGAGAPPVVQVWGSHRWSRGPAAFGEGLCFTWLQYYILLAIRIRPCIFLNTNNPFPFVFRHTAAKSLRRASFWHFCGRHTVYGKRAKMLNGNLAVRFSPTVVPRLPCCAVLQVTVKRR